jgi:hypothetical protein
VREARTASWAETAREDESRRKWKGTAETDPEELQWGGRRLERGQCRPVVSTATHRPIA